MWNFFIQLSLQFKIASSLKKVSKQASSNTVKVPERVRFWHENVHLSANHSSASLSRRAVIGWELYIFLPKSYTFRDFDGRSSLMYRSDICIPNTIYYLGVWMLIEEVDSRGWCVACLGNQRPQIPAFLLKQVAPDNHILDNARRGHIFLHWTITL